MNIESKKRKPSGKKKLSKSLALRRAQTLLEVSARCAAANDLVGVLHALVDITARTLGCDRGTLFSTMRKRVNCIRESPKAI